MKTRKGIIMAGGTGTRLYPITVGVSKQLLPVYDKPMIYYPISVLMLAGIREILIITTPEDKAQFKRSLGDGRQWGLNFQYKIQEHPDGLAQAFILAEDFLDGAPSALILGDNIFFGHGLREFLCDTGKFNKGATIFTYHVSNPQRYGVIEYDSDGKLHSIVEKPEAPKSNHAITGLYFVDCTAPDRAKQVKPSKRGELEITSILNSYLADNQLNVQEMKRGYAWLDTGTHTSLLEASNFVMAITERQGLQLGSPDEIAFRLNWISREQLLKRAELFSKTKYGQYLREL